MVHILLHEGIPNKQILMLMLLFLFLSHFTWETHPELRQDAFNLQTQNDTLTKIQVSSVRWMMRCCSPQTKLHKVRNCSFQRAYTLAHLKHSGVVYLLAKIGQYTTCEKPDRYIPTSSYDGSGSLLFSLGKVQP